MQRDAVPTASAGRESRDPACDPVRVRILCLHGKGGDGGNFANRSLAPLRSLVEKRAARDSAECGEVVFRWDELTAPYELVPGDASGGYSWWTMPPGVRSYNAEEYQGFEKSAAMVMEEIFSPELDDSNKIDVVLGHSQGAILTAALLSVHEKLREPSRSRPAGYILNGAAWPNPYRDSLTSLGGRCPETTDPSPRVLFVMGREDSINPVESALRVHDAFRAGEFDVSIVNHAAGHSVPAGGDEDSVRALEEVVDWIVGIAREKARGR